MEPTEEITTLKARVERLEDVIIEMAETVKLLTEADERAKAFVIRIDEIARSIKTDTRP